jgi:uncharacterized oxidoreductase
MPVVPEKQLEQFAGALLASAGVEQQEAVLVARSLVGANLRGHDSHGVMRIPSYVAQLEQGKLVSPARVDTVKETPSVTVWDGNWGFGQVLAQRLTSRLIQSAREVGVAAGTLRQSGHIGRLGEYAEMAAAEGMALILVANNHGGTPRVAPVGGKRARIGTNPLCIGVPTSAEPVVLDFGTSATAEGKVRVRKIAGQPVPPGWLLDADGKPTTDPNSLYADPPGTILPMGGDQAYKGFGLGLVIDMLAGGFSGGPCSNAQPIPPRGNCVLFIVLDGRHFAGHEHLVEQATQLAGYVRECPTREGVERVLLPGDPERATLAVRSRDGIPLDDGNWKQLTGLADRLGVSAP